MRFMFSSPGLDFLLLVSGIYSIKSLALDGKIPLKIKITHLCMANKETLEIIAS
jgi:hypothetical protein